MHATVQSIDWADHRQVAAVDLASEVTSVEGSLQVGTGNDSSTGKGGSGDECNSGGDGETHVG